MAFFDLGGQFMFEQSKNRAVLSILSRNPNKWISSEQFEFLECNNLDEVLNQLYESKLIEIDQDTIKLDKENYKELILSTFPFLTQIDETVKERIEGCYIKNQLNNNTYDLNQGTLFIVTNYDQQKFLDLYLKLNLESYGYHLVVYQSHEIQPDFLDNTLEVLNW